MPTFSCSLFKEKMDLPDFQNLNQRDFSHLSVDALPGVNSDDSGDYDRKQDDYYSVLNIPRNVFHYHLRLYRSDE